LSLFFILRHYNKTAGQKRKLKTSQVSFFFWSKQLVMSYMHLEMI